MKKHPVNLTHENVQEICDVIRGGLSEIAGAIFESLINYGPDTDDDPTMPGKNRLVLSTKKTGAR